MERLRRQRMWRLRRLARLRRLHRQRYLRMMRARRARRLLMRKLHMKRGKQIKRRLFAAQKRIMNDRQMFKILRDKIINLIYQIRHTRDQNRKNRLIVKLRALIKRSKALRKKIVGGAVKQGANMKKIKQQKKAKAMVKAMIKRQAKILLRKKMMKAYKAANAKINVLKRRIRFNAKRFQRASARAIKRVCRRFRLGRVHCRHLAKQLHQKVKHISKHIVKRYKKKQAMLRANIKRRITQKLVKKTVKGMAKKFERNYCAMGKYRQILDVTCKMDPASCNFFRRSFGDMVPIL